MSEYPYVTNAAWLRTIGRPDAVDEIADQFERLESPVTEPDGLEVTATA